MACMQVNGHSYYGLWVHKEAGKLPVSQNDGLSFFMDSKCSDFKICFVARLSDVLAVKGVGHLMSVQKNVIIQNCLQIVPHEIFYDDVDDVKQQFEFPLHKSTQAIDYPLISVIEDREETVKFALRRCS